MAGIGPVTTNISDLLRRAGARPGISAPKNELEIFCSLCVGRVHYREKNRTLYSLHNVHMWLELAWVSA